MIVDEPPRGRFAYLDFPGLISLPGLEQFRPFMKGQVPLSPLFHLTGLEYVEVGVGTATAAMPTSRWWQSGAGVFTAGVGAFVADAALGGAIHTTLPPKTFVATSQISMDFLRPAFVESGRMIARSRLIQVSRAQGLSEATIEDSFGHLLAHATSRCVLVSLGFDAPEPPSSFPPFEPPEGLDPYLRPVEGTLVDRQTWATKSGLEIMQAWMKGDLPDPPIVTLIGCRVLEAEKGWIVNTMRASEWFCTGARGYHGGILAVQADLAMGGALTTILPPGTAFATLDMKVNYLRPVNPDGRELIGTARVIQSGKRVAFMTAEITDADGKWVAVASSSAMILPGRSWAPEERLSPIDEPAEELAGED
ncbi:MAG TPA: PaaI family thioesterase [Actinomycetota bacterium]|nr:PaaI family thioesterase [Actinomycetota bacterium]